MSNTKKLLITNEMTVPTSKNDSKRKRKISEQENKITRKQKSKRKNKLPLFRFLPNPFPLSEPLVSTNLFSVRAPRTHTLTSLPEAFTSNVVCSVSGYPESRPSLVHSVKNSDPG